MNEETELFRLKNTNPAKNMELSITIVSAGPGGPAEIGLDLQAPG